MLVRPFREINYLCSPKGSVMRKLAVLFLLAVSGLATAADIDTDILGFTLAGSNPAATVQKELRARSRSFVFTDRYKNRKSVETTDISYLGVHWRTSRFDIMNRKNRLYCVEFQTYFFFEEDADNVVGKLKGRFADQYGEPEESGDWLVWKGDNGILLTLQKSYAPSNDDEYYWYVVLSYIDSEGYNMIVNMPGGEL